MPTPRYKILINGKDATKELTPYVQSLTYIDRTSQHSDEGEFTLTNTDQRFTKGNPDHDWSMNKGDTLEISLGYDTDLKLCGKFTVDQLEVQFNPNVVTVKSLAAGINSPLRTKKTVASEGKSLKQIAQAIADAHGFTIDDGTSFTNREKQDWKTERTALSTASGKIRAVITMLGLPTAPLVFPTAIQAAYDQYPIMLATSDSLIAKGRASDGTDIRQETELWARAWRNKFFPTAQESIGIAIAFADKLTEVAASLVDVDRTVTRSKLDIVTAWHTQDNETDLEYMARLAKMYGILFSVKGTIMVFTSVYDVEAGPELTTFTPAVLLSARFTDKQTKKYAGAEVVWHDPDKAEPVVSRVVIDPPAPGAMPGTNTLYRFVDEFNPLATPQGTGEILKVKARVETKAQADEVAKAALHGSTTHELEGEITVSGSVLYCAGINIVIEGFGMFDGKWAVIESRHTVVAGSSDGYKTVLKIKRGR